MTKFLIKKVLVMAVPLFVAGILASCGFNNSGKVGSSGVNSKTTYKYDNSEVMEEVKITKSVYSDEKLTIYISDLGDISSLACYDKNFQYIDSNFSYEYKKNKLIITGEGAKKISGIYINSSSFQKIKLRYLDSSQYAILIDYFVDDLGTETHGDWDAYYSEEEIKAQQKAKAERLREQEDNYKAVEGYWKSVEDNGEYLYFFTDEDGKKWLRQAIYYNEELNIDDTYINTINISEIGIADYYAYYQLEILDSDCWGCCYQFDLNEDMTAIMDWNTKEPGFIKVEGMTPDDLKTN